MTPPSAERKEQHRQAFRDHLAQERASGEPPDTSWTDDLPSDPLPGDDDETSVTFIQKTPSSEE